MRIKKTVSKKSTSFYIIRDYNKNGKRTTKIVHKIGSDKKIAPLAKAEGLTIEQWVNNYLQKYVDEHNDNEKAETILIPKNTKKLINKNTKYSFNVGYLFLEDIYYDLGLHDICNNIQKEFRFKFSINDILSYLVFSRIIYPSSKLKTHKLSKNFIEQPNLELHNIYRGLSYLNKKMDYIKEKMFENSLNVIDRNSKIIYFDCTNYYFEINDEDELRRYGINKQHQPSPQVGMGLFMDSDGIPLAMNIFPGNENEVKHCIPTESKIINNFKLPDSKIIFCADAAMCTDEIKKFNINEGRGFVITQSLKKIKEEYKNEIFEDDGWRIQGDLYHTYKLSEILKDEDKYKNTLFYKIIETETKNVKQDLVVTYSIKYRDYKRKLREGQILRAQNKIKNFNQNSKITIKKNQNDYRRFIVERPCTENGEAATEYIYSINDDLINEEAKYDGYYGLTTNLIDDVSTILKVAKGRWEIEESFRIMKTDFKSRPVELSREDRIKAHFLTCYIALVIYRILEKKLDYNYSTSEILDCIRNLNVLEVKGDGYIPEYERTDLTDELHEIFNFRTDYEIVNYKKYKKIFNQIKNKK
ncbi:MAG: IS1634 family transposase [Romboutsia sp.]|nr:IS1634 family transposase [Romboutsia sp.]